MGKVANDLIDCCSVFSIFAGKFFAALLNEQMNEAQNIDMCCLQSVTVKLGEAQEVRMKKRNTTEDVDNR